MKKMMILVVLVFMMGVVFAAEGEGTFYTENFYMFLGLVFLALILVGVFIWFWIRGPVNRWVNRPAKENVRKLVVQ